MKYCRKHILIIFFCCLTQWLFAQNIQTISYTIKDGLSSNSIYRTVIDHRGLLWIATENGLSRFDGKKFKTYTTSNGLTDNEIINLLIDSSGMVWAIPFGRTPCYYNITKDRFENEKTDTTLKAISFANTHREDVLKYGGIAVYNNKQGLFIIKNGITKAYNNLIPSNNSLPQKIIEYKPGQLFLFFDDSLRNFKNGKIIKSIPLAKGLTSAEIFKDKIYLVFKDKIVKTTLDDTGSIVTEKEKEYPFEIRIFCNTGKNLAITSVNGNTYLLDETTMELKENVYSKTPVRQLQEDKDGNTWLCTIENGLIKMQQKRISSYTDVPEMLQNFNTLIKTNKIIAGTNRGEVYVYDGLFGVRHIQLSAINDMDAWVRKIIETPQGIFIATQKGSYLFDKDCRAIKQSFTGVLKKASKAAILLNDSVLVMGSHSRIFKHNLNTGKTFDSLGGKRTVSLGSDKLGRIYVGSNDGLYRWEKEGLFNFGEKDNVLSYRITTIVCSPDSILWVGLGTDSLIAMKNDKLISIIPLGGSVPGNICKSLFCNKKGELWLGTNKGLNKISYIYVNNSIRWNNTYFGTADGLIGEQVNDITIKNDTVYVATNAGISYLPAGLILPVADIKTFITGINIDNIPEEIKSSYTLPYYKNDITIEFSGVDLTGFIPMFEYSINNSGWQQTDKIELKKLAAESYTIKIRAIKRDGSRSSNEAIVFFHIKKAWWKTNFFRIALLLLFFTGIIYFLETRNRQKQKAAITRVTTEKKMAELEMQALMAQINPHFVFNCLNSIKGLIYEKDFKQADSYLDKFSQLLRNTMDNAEASVISLKDEIIYLDTYLHLEKLRFGPAFDYKIIIAPGLNREKLFVPAMLLQPYVENAIRHGVRHLEDKKGGIVITAVTENGFLVIETDDNGVGREKAAQLKSDNHIEYQSRGMQLSRRRAELYNIQAEVIDKKDEKGNATGTTIRLRIPISLYP